MGENARPPPPQILAEINPSYFPPAASLYSFHFKKSLFLTSEHQSVWHFIYVLVILLSCLSSSEPKTMHLAVIVLLILSA